MRAPAPRRRFDLVAYLKLVRFPLVFTAIADSAAGYLCSTGGNVEAWVLGWLAGASAGLYLFGMALNDIADLERDRKLAPTRVLPSGRLSLAEARLAAGASLAFSFLCVAGLGYTGCGGQHFAPWISAIVFIVAYDFGWLKVPPTMGLVRLSNFLIGAFVVTRVGYDWGVRPYQLLPWALPVFVYVTGLTYVSTLEDSEGHRARLWVGVGIMILGALLASSVRVWGSVWTGGLAMIRGPIQSLPWGIPPGAAALSAVLAAWLVFRARGAGDRKGIMLTVRDGIGGIIFLESAVVVSETGNFRMGIALACLVLPAVISVWIFKKLV